MLIQNTYYSNETKTENINTCSMECCSYYSDSHSLLMKKCKTCGKNCDGDYCFRCKPRKPLLKTVFKVKKYQHKYNDTINKLDAVIEQWEFFYTIWKKRQHICENCSTPLGKEPLSYMFDHILEKSKYPELKFEEQNIWLLCLECHENKTNCNFSEIMVEKLKETKEIFNL